MLLCGSDSDYGNVCTICTYVHTDCSCMCYTYVQYAHSTEYGVRSRQCSCAQSSCGPIHANDIILRGTNAPMQTVSSVTSTVGCARQYRVHKNNTLVPGR